MDKINPVVAMSHAFPDFRITVVPAGVWFATRRRRLTPAERAAGLHYCLARPDMITLILALEDQAALLARLEAPRAPFG